MPVYSFLCRHNHLDEPLFWWHGLLQESLGINALCAFCTMLVVPSLRPSLTRCPFLSCLVAFVLKQPLMPTFPRSPSLCLATAQVLRKGRTRRYGNASQMWRVLTKSWEGIIFTILIHYYRTVYLEKKANRSGLSLFVFAEFDISCCRWNIPLMFQRPYCLKTLLVLLFFFYSSPPPH